MHDERFRPSVTVAAVIEHAEQPGQFLLVEEHTREGLRLNNPAGHLEEGETPQQAVVREVLEEAARAFEPQAFLGIYLARFQRQDPPQDITYVRLAYSGRVGPALPGRTLDTGIVRAFWLSTEEIKNSQDRHRSPLVWQCIADHLAGRRLPLDAVVAHPSLHR
jgi:8-oxo-dGTP pyrophosphatase MutT (NUDIX family)